MTDESHKKDETNDKEEKDYARALANPSFVPNSDDATSLVGLDVTEPDAADISLEARTSLAGYLQDYVQKGRRNNKHNNAFYPPDHLEAEAASHNKGDELTPPVPDEESGSFYRQDETGNLETASFFDPVEQLGNLVDKLGKDNDPKLSGHTLLKEISAQGLGERGIPAELTGRGKMYQEFVVDQLVKSNMYHPTMESPFVNKDAAGEQDATKGLFTIQRDLGSFDKDGTHVSVSHMSSIALALMAQSAGEFTTAGSILEGTIDHGVFQHVFEQAGIYGVSVGKLQIKGLNTTDKELKEIIAAARDRDDFMPTLSQNSLNNRGITGAGAITIKNDAGEDVVQQQHLSSPYNSVSYAQLNSFLEPFGSLAGSGGMLAIAVGGVISIMTLSLLLSGIDALFSGFGAASVGINNGDGDSGWVNPNSPWEYAKGKHRKKELTAGLQAALYKMLRITDTDYDFIDCVSNGLMLLVGFDPGVSKTEGFFSLGSGAALVGFALNLMLSPSYYANLFRQIIRDVNEVTARFREIGGSFTSGISTIASAIEKLVSSKSYQFIMIAAGVGDASLKSIHGQFDVNAQNEPSTERLEISKLKPEDIGEIRKRSTRWGTGGTNTLSLHTFLATNMRQFETGFDESFRKLYAPSAETARQIEEDLEAEYMPFYFHDLRTHEVMSLPAFITSFDESFAVNYTANTGYGRQDPVRTYESTERSMTFEFKLVAFNKEDFNEMWLLVNKLVAMCYPQYSKGRQRSFTKEDIEYKFIQPFSQVPAASPVIRLRLGDVLKSNYSQKMLKKQFDLKMDVHTTWDEAKADWKKTKAKVQAELVSAFRKDKFAHATRIGKLKNPHKQGDAKPFKGALGTLIAAAISKSQGRSDWLSSDTIKILDLSNTIPNRDQDYRVAKVQNTRDGTKWLLTISSSDVLYDETRLSATADADERVIEKSEALEAVARSPEENEAAFFAPNNNAIVRSFNSTRGKGMAGVITSLALGYGDYPYETDYGSRAPKMINVSLGFAPIHDLPLGLDYNGEMRAPSHPVGDRMRGFGDPEKKTKEVGPVKTGLLGKLGL